MRDMFIEAIKTEQERIQRFIDLSSVGTAGRGNLKLQKQGTRIYACERWQKKGAPERTVYLGPLDSAPVRELFSVRYQEKRLKRLHHDQKLLEKLEQQYQTYDFESIVADMPKAYRLAAKDNSFEQRYEEIRRWADAPYPRNTYPFPEAEIYAKDGTRVRSKGECIWYNLMLERGILFRYDSAIQFTDQHGNRKTLSPDFLVLCFDGTLLLIEHLGGMGDLSYAIDFGEKSHRYFQNGFILGRNYFVTSDDPKYGTDSRTIAGVADHVERLFFGY